MAEPITTTPALKEPEAAPTWGDYLSTLFEVGAPETIASASSGLRAIGDRFPDNSAARIAGAVGELGQDVGHQYAGEAFKDLTPAMQERLNTPIDSDAFLEHPISTIAAKATRTAPTILLPVAVAAVAPEGVLGTLLTHATAGAMTATQVTDELQRSWDAQTPEQKAKLPFYKGLVDGGVPPEEADRMARDELIGNTPTYMMLLGGLTSVLGLPGIVRQGAGVGGLATRTGKAMARNFAEETFEETGQDVAGQVQQIDMGMQQGYNYRQTARAGLEGGVIGAVLGVGGGVFKPAEAGVKPKATEDDVSDTGAGTPPAATPAAVAPQDGTGTTGNPSKPPENAPIGNPQSAPTRSATTAPKTVAKKGKAKAEEIKAKAAQPMPDEHVAALAAAKPPAAPQLPPEVTTPADAQPAPVPAQAAPQVEASGGLAAGTPAPVTPTPAPAPVDMAPVEPVLTAPPATPAEVITPVEETESRAPEPGVAPTPRILPDVRKSAVRKQAQIDAKVEKTLGANIAEAELTPEQRALPKGTQKSGKVKKAEKAAKEAQLKQVMAAYAPDTEVDRGWSDPDPKVANVAQQNIFARAERVVNDAAAGGVTPKGTLKGEPDTIPAPVVLLREAADLVNALKKLDRKHHPERILRFLDREKMLHDGDVAGVLALRRSEGDERMATQQKAVEGIAAPVEEKAAALDEATPTIETDYKPEAAEADAAVTKSGKRITIDDGSEKAEVAGIGKVDRAKAASGEKLAPDEKARMIAELNAKLAGEQAPKVTPKGKAKAEEVKAKSEAAPAAAPKKAPIVERIKKRKLVKPDDTVPIETRISFEASNGRIKLANGPIAKSTGHTTARELLSTMPPHEPANPRAKAITRHLLKRLADVVGDVEVIYVPHDSLQITEEGKVRNPFAARWGYYQNGGHWVVLSDKVQTLDPAMQTHIILHELVHAATVAGLNWGPASRAVKAVMDEVRARGGTLKIAGRAQSISATYGMLNEREFLAEALTNPEFQEWLANTPISAELAARLNMPEWRNATLWKALVVTIRRMLNLPANMTSALEAALSLAERATWALDPDAEAQFSRNAIEARRLKTAVLEQADPIELPTAKWAQNELTDTASGFNAWFKEKWVQLRTLNQLAKDFGDNATFGTSLRELVAAINKQMPDIARFKEQYGTLANRLLEYSKTKESREFARLALAVRAIDGYIIEGGDPATINDHPKNAHGGKRARRGWQMHAQLPGLQAAYNKLSPEGRALFQELAQFYHDTHNQVASKSVAALLDAAQDTLDRPLTPAELSGIVRRTLDEDLTEADEALLGGALFHTLEKEASFHKVKGMYFPEMRYGNHVVVTEDDISDTMGGTLEGNDTVVFKAKSVAAAEKLAKAFVEKSDLNHMSTKTLYFDATTGKKVTADDATGLNDVEYGVAVRMQVRGVHMFDSRKAGLKFIRENEEGYTRFLTPEPEPRLGTGYQAHILTGTQMQTLMSSVNKRLEGDDNKHKREMIRAILTQAGARMMSGNRVTHRRLKSQHVSGASTDMARGLMNYGEAAARHVATARAAPLIRKAMNEMRDQLHNYMGKDRPDLVRVYNELLIRLENSTIEPNEASTWMKDALALSYFARLGSPAANIINATQVITVTAPMLNGRYGAGRGTAAIGRAYADIGLGDNLIAGFMNTVRATKGWGKAGLTGLTDVVGNERATLAKLSDGAELARVYDAAVEANAISLTSGFEVSESHAEGRGAWGKTISKVDRILRQMPQVIENINRTVTLVATYRLARASGMNEAKATQHAIDMVDTTQGNYASANQPRLFNNPYLRPAAQFKKYAQMITYVLATTTHNAFMNADAKERRIAQKQLMHIMATQVAMAGALSLPGLEFAKVGFMVTAALGLTGGWEDQEEWLRGIADDAFGKTWGQLVTSGVITRAMGIDVTSRMSYADLWTSNGEPKRAESESVQAFILRQAVGSPGTLAIEYGEGMGHLFQGDFAKAGEKLIPFKTVTDTVKAANGLSSGKSTLTDAALKVVGFQSARKAEEGRKIGVSARRAQREEAQYKALSKEYREAISLGARARVRAKIIAFNKGVRSYRNRVQYNAIDKYRGKDYSKTVN
jgi:hypothetical protein